jgi:hypothetical protein
MWDRLCASGIISLVFSLAIALPACTLLRSVLTSLWLCTETPHTNADRVSSLAAASRIAILEGRLCERKHIRVPLRGRSITHQSSNVDTDCEKARCSSYTRSATCPPVCSYSFQTEGQTRRKDANHQSLHRPSTTRLSTLARSLFSSTSAPLGDRLVSGMAHMERVLLLVQ